MNGTWTGECRLGWTWSGRLLHQWTGNSGRPLCVRELDSADLGLGRHVCGTQRDPARAILGRSCTRDKYTGHKMDEAPTVVIPGNSRLGWQNGVLAVGAEHFGSWWWRGTIGHFFDLGQFVLQIKLLLEQSNVLRHRCRRSPQNPTA